MYRAPPFGRGDHSFTKPLTRSPRESRAPIETNGSDSGHRLYSYTPGIGPAGLEFCGNEALPMPRRRGGTGREGKGREAGQGRLYTLSGWRDDESAILRREQEDRTADGRERGRVRSTSACIETPPPPRRCPNPELGSHSHHLQPFLISRRRLCSSRYV